MSDKKQHRQPYPAEFREQMVAPVRAGRSPDELAAEFEPTSQTIRNWVRQADLDEGRRSDGLTSSEREELRRLRIRHHCQHLGLRESHGSTGAAQDGP